MTGAERPTYKGGCNEGSILPLQQKNTHTQVVGWLRLF